jgi:hypothetical protein
MQAGDHDRLEYPVYLQRQQRRGPVTAGVTIHDFPIGRRIPGTRPGVTWQ